MSKIVIVVDDLTGVNAAGLLLAAKGSAAALGFSVRNEVLPLAVYAVWSAEKTRTCR